MKREWFGKIKNYLLIVISIALIITGVQLYQEKQESKRQYELFLNHFYHELSAAIRTLHSVLEQPQEGRNLEQALLHVERGLERTDSMLDVGSNFIAMPFAHTSIFSNHPIRQFADDDTLSSEEVHYLENLKKDLGTIQAGLYSDETGQEDTTLSISTFNNIITGSVLDSGFLTLERSITLPLQIVELEQAPNEIQKWIDHNASTEQKKVFPIDDNTYVLIISGHDHQVEITDIVRTGDVIAVSLESEKQSQSDDEDQKSAVTIAKLEMETERPFEFTTPGDVDIKNENTGNNSNSNAVIHGASVETELVSPEMLSDDGKIVE